MPSEKKTVVQGVIHYFDPAGHRIACGVPGFDRSTKHQRSVTCPSCIEAIRDADSHASSAAGAAS